MITQLLNLFIEFSIAHDILILSSVIALGLIMGQIRAGSVQLGIAGVLFTGLIFGHFGLTISPDHIHFIKEFGLVLFVYAIGMQVGPGFFTTFRREGIQLNIMAFAIVAMGAAITVAIILALDIQVPVAVGLFSGGTTNTPSLGAAQETLAGLGARSSTLKVPGLAYAMAYPFGVIGVILAMILTKSAFRVNPIAEALDFEQKQKSAMPALNSLNLLVENKNIDGVKIMDIPSLAQGDITISRVMHEENVVIAQPETPLYLNDIVHVVAPPQKLKDLQILIGSISPIDLRGDVTTDITARRVIFTEKRRRRLTVGQVQHSGFGDILITRIWRAGIEFAAKPETELQFGDTLLVVAEEGRLAKAAEMLGDNRKAMETAEIMPFFLGILLGILVGSFPFHVPGIPVPIKLGLSGGPLLVAIILSSLRSVGRVSWHVPPSANHMIREIGITLFLACVGLNSGDQFIHTLTQGDGVRWILLAAMITLIPLITVVAIARALFKVNYLSLCGLLAGSMTDPPALAFAGSQSRSSATSVAYASVYPLVMILRVVSVQLIVIFFY